MNKKFLSALLCGATLLASTSTFVSCKDYDDDINSLENKLTNEISAREALAAKVTAAEAAIKDLQTAKAELEAELAKKENTADHAADIAVINGEIAVIKAAIEKLEKSLEDYATKKELASEVAQLNLNIDLALQTAKEYTDAACALLQGKIDGLNTELGKTNTNLEQLSKDLSDLLGKYNTLNDKLFDTNGEIARLDAAIGAQEAALKSAQETLEKAIKDGDAATLAEAQKKIDALKTTLETSIADLKKELENADKKLQDQIDVINAELAKKADKTYVDQKLSDLKKDFEIAIQTVNGEIEDINKAIKDLNDNQIPALTTQISDISDDLDVVTQILAKKLRSIVLRPQLYVDGIEAVQYRVLFDEDIHLVALSNVYLPAAVHQSWDPSIRDKQPIAGLTDYQITPASKRFWNAPAWPVQYHMNPSTANPTFADVKGWFCEEKNVVNRAATADLGITVEEFYRDYKNGSGDAANTQLFGLNNGDLTVGIRINDPRPLFFNGPRAIITDGSTTGCNHTTDCSVVEGESESTHFDPATGSFTGSTTALVFNPWLAMETAAGKDDVEWVGGAVKHSNHLDNIVALEMKAENDIHITSDYALLHATGVTIEGLVWKDNVSQIKTQKVSPIFPCDELEYNYDGYKDGLSAVKGNYECGKSIHVWDTPEEALRACKYDQRNYVCLPYNNTQNIKLEDYLALHYFEQNASRTGYYGVQTWEFTGKYDDPTKDLRNYGVWYEFETVDYAIDGNASYDSRYMTLDDATDKAVMQAGAYDRHSATGLLKAGRVDADGKFKDEISYSSVGREPLVRVLVHAKDNQGNDHVILDGYILVKITKELITTSTEYKQNVKFDLCNGNGATMLTWSQFSSDILHDMFGASYTKTMFDALYGPEEHDSRMIGTTGKTVGTFKGAADGFWEYGSAVSGAIDTYKFRCHLYADNTGSAPDQNVLGEVTYYHDAHSATNFRIVWNFSAEDLEYISHNCGDPLSGTSTYSAWIRWTAHNTNHVAGDTETGDPDYPTDLKGDNAAKYDIIWVKLTVTVDRDHVLTYTFDDDYKIDNYWWGHTTPGAPADKTGWDAILLNTATPAAGLSPYTWFGETWKTLDENVLYLNKQGAGKTLCEKAVASADCELTDNCVAKYYVAPVDKKVVSKYDVNSSGADATNHASDHRAGTVCDPGSDARPLTWEVVPMYSDEIKSHAGGNLNDGAPVEYIITAYCPTHNDDYNCLVPRYQAPNNTGISNYDGSYAGRGNACPTTHKFVPTKTDEWDIAQEWEDYANKIVDECCIDYQDGVYENDFIYVVRASDRNSNNPALFHKLAKLDQHNGVIELYHDSYTYAVLNAIGYDKHETSKMALDKELRAMIGVIARDKCDNAQMMKKSLFMPSWERPLNMVTEIDYAIDARTSGNRIYLADIIKLYDWRGYDLDDTHTSTDPQVMRGCMEQPSSKWLWAYYGVEYTKIDFRYDKVMTDLDSPDDGPKVWKTLKSISPKGLVFTTNGGFNAIIYNPNSWISGYNNPANSLALYNQFQTNTARRNQLGYIEYDNNGYNVQNFDLIVPITVGYVWGELTENILIHVHNTIGNED